jgi:hypothetical protein
MALRAGGSVCGSIVGTTIATQYAKLGVTLRCANMDHLNGWAEILQGVGNVEGGKLLLALARCARGDRVERRLFERREETICDRRKLTGMTIGDYAAGS